ncbi:DNase I-like protein [Venustampulla echinocandica]|uniref:CCR4-Not complex 3'-5'-exoribonuclease subunit Ccr4 n=1 Tax=Venustampulla echinocandica TaxID=2656787 RepID=A0A370U005_9HELO|nr:DNase I-like protein [Venustampulla echinocandica]RDL41112.1 DNase I-like protein [Venustampulla echinocandica]
MPIRYIQQTYAPTRKNPNSAPQLTYLNIEKARPYSAFYPCAQLSAPTPLLDSSAEELDGRWSHHSRHQITRNGTPPNNLRSTFTTETPSPSRSPDSHSPAQTLYGMFNQGHQQGQHGRVNGGPGRGLPLMYNFQHQNAHQTQHTQHHANIQQDHTTHTTNGSVLNHHTNYPSGVLSNSTPSFTPNNLQNGTHSTTRGGQAQQISEHWTEQLKLHKESENANLQMVDHSAPNHFARQRATENRGLASASTADSSATQEEDNENRGRPYRQDIVKRQDWHNLDLSGQGLRVLANPLFNYDFLNELYIASNKIPQIPASVGQLRALTHLDASFNSLKELPRELGMCVRLKSLLVFNNSIQSLPNELGALHQLEMLGIEGNPIPPGVKQEIMERGTKSLIRQLREDTPVPMPPPPRKMISLQDGIPPPTQERLRVSTYNILCDKACTQALYGYNPSIVLSWEYRREQILNEIQEQDADIVCLQEVDSETHYEYLSPKLAYRDYKGVHWPRPRSKTMPEKEAKLVDGCATFYKGSKFILLDKVLIDIANIAINRPDMKNQHDIFNRVMPRDNIAIMTFLENRITGSRVIVVNTHLHWDPTYADVKLIQMAILIENINKIAGKFAQRPPSTEKEKKAGLVDENGSPDPKLGQEFAPSLEYSSNTQVPLILCGDLNSVPDSSVYDLLSKGSIKPSHQELTNFQYGNFTKNGIDHPFSLRSAYSALDKTPDRLVFTNYTPTFRDVIDHIWYSTNTLELTGLLGGVDSEYMKTVPGFPNHHFPSDHLPLVAEFMVKGRKEKKTHPEPDFGSSSRRRD